MKWKYQMAKEKANNVCIHQSIWKWNGLPRPRKLKFHTNVRFGTSNNKNCLHFIEIEYSADWKCTSAFLVVPQRGTYRRERERIKSMTKRFVFAIQSLPSFCLWYLNEITWNNSIIYLPKNTGGSSSIYEFSVILRHAKYILCVNKFFFRWNLFSFIVLKLELSNCPICQNTPSNKQTEQRIELHIHVVYILPLINTL